MKHRITLYLDGEVLRAAKALAARTGRTESDILDDALRQYLAGTAVASVWARSPLSEEEAETLAYEELHAMRDERDKGRGVAE